MIRTIDMDLVHTANAMLSALCDTGGRYHALTILFYRFRDEFEDYIDPNQRDMWHQWWCEQYNKRTNTLTPWAGDIILREALEHVLTDAETVILNAYLYGNLHTIYDGTPYNPEKAFKEARNVILELLPIMTPSEIRSSINRLHGPAISPFAGHREISMLTAHKGSWERACTEVHGEDGLRKILADKAQQARDEADILTEMTNNLGDHKSDRVRQLEELIIMSGL